MKFFPFSRFDGSARMTVAAVAALCLSACDDKPADEAKPAEESKPAEQPTEKTISLADSKEALFNKALYDMVQKVTNPTVCPKLNIEVQELHGLLETYYTALCKENGDAAERARVALMIAKTLRDLGLYDQAKPAYERAIADIETAQGDNYDKSAAYKGIAACLMVQNDNDGALEWYKKALEMDEAAFQAALPTKDGEQKNARELVKATVNLLDAYRDMGECQRFAGDSEGALATYEKGQEVINKFRGVSPEIAVSAVKLLSALGDYYNENGQLVKAHDKWVIAANNCQTLYAKISRVDTRDELSRCFNKLIPAIRMAEEKLNAKGKDNNEEVPAAAAEAAADIAQTEPLAPLPAPEVKSEAAPEPAPAAAPAKPQPAKPQPAKPNNKNRR